MLGPRPTMVTLVKRFPWVEVWYYISWAARGVGSALGCVLDLHITNLTIVGFVGQMITDLPVITPHAHIVLKIVHTKGSFAAKPRCCLPCPQADPSQPPAASVQMGFEVNVFIFWSNPFFLNPPTQVPLLSDETKYR